MSERRRGGFAGFRGRMLGVSAWLAAFRRFCSARGLAAGRMALVSVAFAVTVWETTILIPAGWVEWLVALLHLVCLLAMVRWPVKAGCLLLAVGYVADFIPGYSGPSLLWGGLLALGFVGCYASTALAATMLGATLLFQVVQTWTGYGVGFDSLPFFAICFTLSTVAGYALRKRRKTEELRESQHRLELALQRTRVAIHMHDEVSGRLSLLARDVQRRRRLSEDPGQREMLDDLNGQILQVIDCVHNVVNELSEPSHAPETSDEDRLPLAEYAGALDRRLHGLGYSGRCAVSQLQGIALGRRQYEATRLLLDELCANIRKHADPQELRYEISVRSGDGRIEISEVCRWHRTAGGHMAHADSSDQVMGGGQGLRTRRRMFEELGGSFQWAADGDRDSGSWKCFAWLPTEQPKS